MCDGDRWLRIVVVFFVLSLTVLACSEPAEASEKTFLGRTTTDWIERLSARDPLDRVAAVKALGVLHAVQPLNKALEQDDTVIRYWAAVELGRTGRTGNISALRVALQDDAPSVRIAAAEAVCHLGQPKLGVPVLVELLEHPLDAVRLGAISSLESIGLQAVAARDAIDKATGDSLRYVVRLATRLTKRFDGAEDTGR